MVLFGLIPRAVNTATEAMPSPSAAAVTPEPAIKIAVDLAEERLAPRGASAGAIAGVAATPPGRAGSGLAQRKATSLELPAARFTSLVAAHCPRRPSTRCLPGSTYTSSRSGA